MYREAKSGMGMTTSARFTHSATIATAKTAAARATPDKSNRHCDPRESATASAPRARDVGNGVSSTHEKNVTTDFSHRTKPPIANEKTTRIGARCGKAWMKKSGATAAQSARTKI